MDNHAIIKLIIFVIIFLAGLYFYVFYPPKNIEGLETIDSDCTSSSSDSATNKKKNDNSPRCPNVLIQKGAKYYLYNSNVDKVPGVNPIMFNNLEEYVAFLDWQRDAGIRCPVLYVQNSYNAQGEREYKIRPSVTDLQGGLPPSVISSPKRAQYVIKPSSHPNAKINVNIDDSMLYTNDNDNESDAYPSDSAKSGISPNPMDPNWGGDKYTQGLVDAGYYADNEISIAIN